MKQILLVLLILVGTFVVNYLMLAAIVWALAVCFGFTFTWKLALGIDIVCIFVIAVCKAIKGE